MHHLASVSYNFIINQALYTHIDGINFIGNKPLSEPMMTRSTVCKSFTFKITVPSTKCQWVDNSNHGDELHDDDINMNDADIDTYPVYLT